MFFNNQIFLAFVLLVWRPMRLNKLAFATTIETKTELEDYLTENFDNIKLNIKNLANKLQQQEDGITIFENDLNLKTQIFLGKQNKVKELKQKLDTKLENEVISKFESISKNLDMILEAHKKYEKHEDHENKMEDQLNSNLLKYDSVFNCIEYCAQPYTLPTKFQKKLENSTLKIDSIYLLDIEKSYLPSFNARCYSAYNHTWLIIQRRKDGSENFFRKWNEYRNGFGNLYGEYWLGLERLHEITKNHNYELWIQLKYFGMEKNFFYSNFSIDSEADNYRLKISGYNGDENAENFFEQNNDKEFSTYDKYDYSNFAQLNEGGWWYDKSYFITNLNGPYGKNVWTRNTMQWDFHDKAIRYMHMAIRPIYE